jgi:hypothetical protein
MSVRQSSHALTLLPAIFSMFDDLPAEGFLWQIASCMDKPNSWNVITNVNGKPVVWPKREAVNGVRVR